jgi:signal transduction histidine kinase
VTVTVHTPCDVGRTDNGDEAFELTAEDLTRACRQVQHATERQISAAVRILHDDLGGLLVSAIMDLSWVNGHSLSAEDVDKRLMRVHQALAAAIDLKRNLIESLRPSILENFGLIAAFRWHMSRVCERTESSCSHNLPEQEPRLRSEASIAIFRIGQEILTSVLAEPQLKRVDLLMSTEVDELLLQIAHDHLDIETVDMVAHASSDLYPTLLRIEGLGGRWSIDRHASGSVMRASFPWRAICPV